MVLFDVFCNEWVSNGKNKLHFTVNYQMINATKNK